jgi:hypothetical protein
VHDTGDIEVICGGQNLDDAREAIFTGNWPMPAPGPG